jgi:hypothetical protein
MGVCCQTRYQTDFHGAINTKELLYLYNKDLDAVKKVTKEIEASGKVINQTELRFFKIFILKVEDLKRKIASRELEEIEKIKDMSFDLFGTLDTKNEEQFKNIYLHIIQYLKETKSD